MAHGVYRIGLATRLFRLDDPSGPWVDISLDTHGIPFVDDSVFMTDVQTIPGQDDSVFICGTRKEGVELGPDFYGIAFSHDAGNTWVEPSGGDYQNISFSGPDPVFFLKIWVVDPNTIYVTCSNGHVYKSTNGGNTFNQTNPIPDYIYNWVLNENGTYTGKDDTPIINPLHFRNPVFGVVGMVNAVAVTTNGGNNWTVRNIDPNTSPSPLPGLARGVHINDNGQHILIAGTDSIMKSYDGGVTWGLKWNWNVWNAQGWHLTRYGETNFIAFGSNGMILRSDNAGETWSTIPGREYASDGPDHIAGDLYALDHGYFNSWDGDMDIVHRTIDGFLVPTIDSWQVEALAGYPTQLATFALWTRETGGECYKLVNCEDSEDAIYITTTGIADYLGQIVELCPEDFPGQDLPSNFTECTCFTIERIDCDQTSTQLLTISGDTIINNLHEDCIVCLGNCFKLVDCEDPTHIIYTNENYTQYVGSVITLSFPSHATGLCWEVFEDDCSHGYEQTKMIEEVGTCCHCESTRPECQCYELARCGWHGPAVLVHPADNWLEPFVDGVIQHPDLLGGYCYEVSLAESCDNSIELPIIAVNSYNNCICCTDTIYVLQDCRNEGWDPESGDPMPGLPDVYSTLDCLTEQQLGQVLDAIENGQVLQFAGNGVCWKPAVAVDCPEPEELDDVVPDFEVFEDCETCLAVPPPVIQQNVRSIKPGYDTPGCDPAYTEKVNCTFANAMYNKMSVERYGVKMCCDLDIEKWAIKKELLELKAIYEPTMCDTAVETPSCPPEPDIEYPTATPV